jgi:hypothetical protein
MWNSIVAGMLAVALSAVPTIARAAPELPSANAEARLYGLPIFTSDGLRIGAVAETGTDDDGYMVLLLAELEGTISTGPQIVAIPLELILLRADRIDLFLSETEVRERLSAAKG